MEGYSSKSEARPESFDWVEKQGPQGLGNVVHMQFPSGASHPYKGWGGYEEQMRKDVYGEKSLADIISSNDLLLMFNNAMDNISSVLWLRFAFKHYPERMEDYYKKFEEAIILRLKEDEVANVAFDKKNELRWNDAWWFGRLEEDKFDPIIKKRVVELLLTYAPPIGSTKRSSSSEPEEATFQLNDYLTTDELKKEYADCIPNIGSGWKAVHEEFESNPIQAFKDVLSNPPAYNAGKKANYFGMFVTKFKDSLEEEELIALVNENMNIGAFDKDPIIAAIKKSFK
ncbi:MAG: hypothetical protein HGB03_00620 [Candidatus Yonathbacteria bacterium]|nr:hypothetical protein [Candidatus Yonathbacteria bacterium]NTW47765.1 hypothetical protein [Candidatus Yonathbacteria bacterium]